MAKKKRKHEEEKQEKEYKPPEFDEREFLEEEMTTAKATLISVVLSIPMAVVAYMVLDSAGAGTGFLIGILGMALIYMLIPRFSIEISSFKAKHWIGIFSTYFFAFLAIWVLLVNPPFADHASPQFITIDTDLGGEPVIILGPGNNTTAKVELNQIDIDAGANVTIDAKVTDNDLMGTVFLRVGDNEYNMANSPDNHYTYTLENVAENTTITLVAEDASGNTRTYEIYLT
ncbi:MAG: hypothetical protein KAS67_02510 [Thermoplasmata archaeon]|nr:hypothetical protein [Thermoplasmata archaeon]